MDTTAYHDLIDTTTGRIDTWLTDPRES
jgi:hypothetical protein